MSDTEILGHPLLIAQHNRFILIAIHIRHAVGYNVITCFISTTGVIARIFTTSRDFSVSIILIIGQFFLVARKRQ